ncbi:MAG: hypothetical protein KatS3mg087_1505 [Patescibacteria group bacterium]|nr:MAG: hypothetical protein KatS3mg087_1505 [Patescibacteria group bacterium]
MVAEASESAIEVLSGAHEDPEYIIRLAAVRALVEIGQSIAQTGGWRALFKLRPRWRVRACAFGGAQKPF